MTEPEAAIVMSEVEGNGVENVECKTELESIREHDDALVLDATYNISAKELRDSVFMDNSNGGTYHGFLTRMKYFEVQLPLFTQEGLTSGDSGTAERTKQRTVTFKISSPMGNVGPKEVDVEDTQVVLCDNKAGFIMESSVKTSKVMYSNSFRVRVIHKLLDQSESDPKGNKCSLRCTLKVDFIKSVMGMIKKQIRAETIKQMQKKYSTLHQCITHSLAEDQSLEGHLGDSTLKGESLPVAEDEQITQRRRGSFGSPKREVPGSDKKVTGWLLKRSKTLRKWNTRYCEFCIKSGRLEWRKKPDDPDCNGYLDINAYTDIQRKSIKSGPHGMEDCGFVITYEKKVYYFSADTPRQMHMWCTAIKEYIQNCSIVTVNSKTSFDDSPTMMVKFSIGEAIDLDNLDPSKKSERMVYFRMSVGNHVKRSKAMKTSKAKSSSWKQTFSFPIRVEDNPEIIMAGEECYNDNLYSMGKTIGMVSLPLWAFTPHQGVQFWACLRNSAHLSSPISGKVQVHILIEDSISSSSDWETRDDVTLFDERDFQGKNAKAASNTGNDYSDTSAVVYSSAPFSWKSLLCCGLMMNRKQEKDQYQLLQEIDDL